MLCLALLAPASDSAAGVYRKARKAQSKGDYTNAYLLASKAVALDPNNSEYWQFSQAVRRQGMPGLKVDLGKSAPEAADPEADDQGLLSDTEIRQARELLPPVRLVGAPGRKSFNLRGDSKRLWDEVLKQFGLAVIFDSDYLPSPPVQFRMENVTWTEAARSLEACTGTFIVAVTDKVGLVAKDTLPKRTELEPAMTAIIPYPEPLTPQEVQEAVTAVRTLFDLTKVGVDNGRHAVVIKDRVSRLKPAVEFFRQLMLNRAQVVTEVELLSYNSESTLNYGLTLQSLFPIAWFGEPTSLRTTPTYPSGATYFPTFGGGKSAFGLGITNTGLMASLTRGQSQSVFHAELRSLDGQAAQLHVGDRYPILTSGYYGDTSGSGTVYRPPPTVNFEDLGVVLKVTPRVHGAKSVTLEIEAEFKTLSGQASNDIPIISNRKFAMHAGLNFDETAVVAGVVQDTFTQSWSGLPLLIKIPGLRSNDKSTLSNRILLTLKPRLVSLGPTEFPGYPIRSGSEGHPLSPLD
jgi:hypothetical protein